MSALPVDGFPAGEACLRVDGGDGDGDGDGVCDDGDDHDGADVFPSRRRVLRPQREHLL